MSLPTLACSSSLTVPAARRTASHAERFIAVGKGAENPIAPNTTEDGRALNRRTDIKVVLNAQ